MVQCDNKNNKMTPRQKLMLFLISSDPGIRGDYKMQMFYDRTDFPAKVTENLKPMLAEGLIKPSKYYDNKTVSEYEITEKGKLYLDKHFDEIEIFNYIKTVHNPDFLMEITKKNIDKKKTI
jgi:DNA-binding MarR family transcriptional regulator